MYKKSLYKTVICLAKDKEIAEQMIADMESLTDEEWKMIDKMADNMDTTIFARIRRWFKRKVVKMK